METLKVYPKELRRVKREANLKEWQNSVRETHGCLADAPITRGTQGVYAVRAEM